MLPGEIGITARVDLQ